MFPPVFFSTRTAVFLLPLFTVNNEWNLHLPSLIDYHGGYGSLPGMLRTALFDKVFLRQRPVLVLFKVYFHLLETWTSILPVPFSDLRFKVRQNGYYERGHPELVPHLIGYVNAVLTARPGHYTVRLALSPVLIAERCKVILPLKPVDCLLLLRPCAGVTYALLVKGYARAGARRPAFTTPSYIFRLHSSYSTLYKKQPIRYYRRGFFYYLLVGREPRQWKTAPG